MDAEAVPAAAPRGPADQHEAARGAVTPQSAHALLFVLCGVLYLDGLDVSLAGVTLPSIQRDLGLDAAQLQWIVSAYVLGYGGLLLLGGRAADLFGRRRVLLAGLGVFGAVSLLSGLTSVAVLLIAARFIEGSAAAFTDRMARDTWGCRPGTAGQRLDAGGAARLTAAMLAVVWSVVRAPSHGWLSGATLAGLAVALAAVAAFAVIERRHPQPLVRLSLFRTAPLWASPSARAAPAGSWDGPALSR